ncbi:glycosyltransferase family 4 protein [Anabaena cylindrica]|uniref:Glycosyltransferase n=1 Tax=Anabaena cylindrica FACHB-318 TaxID=2692880 RepID=A0ABR7ZGR7_ANACY|nr:glycosyltransferase [Anabaena cylindrica]MBD2171705.1 glycosyltransferase [Anabaena cylindrica FACHB-318]
MMQDYPLVAIAWSGLPIYAANSIKKAIDKFNKKVIVIGSHPSVPVEGMEHIIGQTIHWIDAHSSCSWSRLKLPIPDILFQTGWRNQGFNDLAKEVRKNGGHVISMIDNSWKNNPRQWLGSIVFRFIYRYWFNAVWVPGVSGIKLCSFLGVPTKIIYTGLYCASQETFYPGLPLSQRKKKFLFVGRFIKRKGVDLLVQAFNRFQKEFSDWHLHVIGCGDMANLFHHNPNIIIDDFKPSQYIAEVMRESRFFILPSREEHWGVVVHEAALSGCGIICSKNVGASADLVSDENGFLFMPSSVDSLYEAMVKAASIHESELELVFNESLRLSFKFNPDIWATTFIQIIEDMKISK